MAYQAQPPAGVSGGGASHLAGRPFSVPPATVAYLASLEWITARENLCLVGPTVIHGSGS